MPAVFRKSLQKQKGLRIVGRTDKVRQHFYAISAERKLQHPAVVAISNAAQQELFK
jgi:LysR family transcriptional activator of nhaA